MSDTNRQLYKIVSLSALFAIAMAYLESAVVVYLRELYYPDGFSFPLREIPMTILITEIGREAATMVMLGTYAWTAGTNRREIFAYFALNFGIWDIWYYIWLKLLIGWPATLLDWDILFLIPVPWVGPVLAPVLVSFSLIAAGMIILVFERQNRPLSIRLTDWLGEILAGMIIIWSFLTESDTLSALELPDSYSWVTFFIGLAGGWYIFIRRVLKTRAGSQDA